MCQKQSAVSHSSTESEIISLDAGLRLDGVAALDLRDLTGGDPFMNKREVRSTPHTVQK